MTTWTRAPYPYNSLRHGDTMIAGDGTTRELNAIMEFDRVVMVDAAGVLTDDYDVTRRLAGNAPDMLYMELDADGQCVDSDARNGVDALCDTALGDWTPVSGATGQQGSTGKSFVMHSSEYIGGGLTDRVLSTPGYYVAVLVDGLLPDGNPDSDDTLIGWALLHRALT